MKESLQAFLQRSPLNGVLLMLLLVFTGASVFSFIGFAISELALSIPLLTEPDLLDDLSDPELLPALRLMQVLQAIGMLILPSFVYLWLSSTWKDLKVVFAFPQRQAVLISLVFFMVAFPTVNYLAEWNSNITIPFWVGDWMKEKEVQAGSLTALFLNMPSIPLLVFNLFMIALLPAVGEELIFRGIIQQGFYGLTRNKHVAIWLAAVLFSAVHMQFFGFVPRLLMGVAMGYLFLWSGNLWYPTIAHFTNNAVSVVLAYGVQHGLVSDNIETAGLGDPVLVSFSLIFCLMLLYLFKEQQSAIGGK
ncbi:MAG: hypothetical protein RL266_2215 [Bacteroidota bacterium]